MTLVIQCPICTQSLVYRGPSRTGQATTCPVCEAPLAIRNPRLGEQEILRILGRPPVHA